VTTRVLVLGAVVALVVLLLLGSVLPASKGGVTAPSGASSPSLVHVAVAPTVTPLVTAPSAFWTGMPASVVLGQQNFTGSSSTANASTITGFPEDAAMDSQGNIWTTDFGSNRVLEFRAPFSTGESASIVLGQSTFTGNQSGTSAVNLSGPAATAIDAKGDLWVSDWGNNRVLEYVPPFHSGMAASLVLGQSGFDENSSGVSATSFDHPIGISFDTLGDLWLADANNNRTLEFRPPFTTGMAASLVLGQSSFDGNQPAVTATNLSYPGMALVVGNILWVADSENDRVVGYSEPFTTGEAANWVLGQSSLTTTGATGEGAFSVPTSVGADRFGNLWVSDYFDSRVLEFTPPFSNFQDPTIALGQSNLTGTYRGTTARNLTLPMGTLFDSSGNLWVTDAGNGRLLEYIPSHYTVTVTPSGLLTGTTWTASLGGQSQTGTGPLHFSETNGTFDLDVTPVAGLRADPAVGEVTVDAAATSVSVDFSPVGPNPFSNGMPASLVLGQPNFNSSFSYSPINASDLSTDWNAAFDSKGNLWVADEGNNRVLEFKPPFTNYMTASLVIGQSNFSGNQSGDSATALYEPNGIAFDASGDLWVSDSANDRVLEYTPPFSNGEAATLVLGQTGFGADGSGTSATQLTYPFGLEFNHGNLWVTDSENDRVVEYVPPFSTGEAATTVLGQSTFTGYQGSATATNLSDPSYLAFDAHGDLWVSDFANSRVLEYPSPFSTGEAATVVLGQPNLTSSDAHYPDSLDAAGGVWVDAHGDVWVADFFHSRVFEYTGPTIVTNQTPSVVIGQGNLTTTGPNTSRTGLFFPTTVLQDPAGNLWVVDGFNARVLEYAPSQFAVNFTATGLPGGTSWGVSVNGTASSNSNSVLSVPEENGTYDWTATPVPGWTASPASGTVTLNGAGATVAIVYSPFSYTVTFTEKGLPAGTSWSVTIGSVTQPGTGTSLNFNEPNGSYSYTVGGVSGYTATNGSGPLTVSGAPASVTITFTVSSSSSSGLGGLSTLDWLLIAVVVIVLAALAAVLLMRRRKAPPAAATAWTPPTGSSAPPPGAMGPPPGAMGPPPPGGPPGPPTS
jgi:sugar lactone lactonase YvrE